MSEVILDAKGRIMLPKRLRDTLGLDVGSRVRLSLEGNRIVVAPPVSPGDFMSKMRGCIKEGSAIREVDPIELKRIWESR